MATLGDFRKHFKDLDDSVTVRFRYYPSVPENINMQLRRVDHIDGDIYITVTPGGSRGVSIPENQEAKK